MAAVKKALRAMQGPATSGGLKGLAKGGKQAVKQAGRSRTMSSAANNVRQASGQLGTKAMRQAREYAGSSVMDGGLRGTLRGMAQPQAAKFSGAGFRDVTKAAGIGGVSSSVMESGLGVSMKSATKQAGKNLSDTGWDMAKSDIARRTVQYGAGGALAGGAISAAQGEDFWEGAGRGMVAGGMTGAGVSGVRMATGAGKNQNVFAGAKAFANETGVSKSVSTLGRVAQASKSNPVNMRNSRRMRNL